MTQVDADFVQRLAAVNGYELAAERAELLLPAVRAVLAVDAQLAVLELAHWPTAGLPWAAAVSPVRAPRPAVTHGPRRRPGRPQCRRRQHSLRLD